MTAESRPLRSLDDRLASIRWEKNSPLTLVAQTPHGDIKTRLGRFVGGRADGVEVVEIDTGAVVVRVLPTRGMGIWDLDAGGRRFGWRSPVDGPVHPAHVPLHDPSGLGWLEGFDELVVRCGLESNGAPEHDENGRLRYPLHGRIGNLPADSLWIEIDEASGRLDLIGELLESRLFFKRLRLRCRIRCQAGSADVELLDDLTNELSTPATAQLLYHVNLGTPLLGNDAGLEAPVAELAPKDDLSAGEIDQWNRYPGPTVGYSERVYFAELQADEAGKTTAMLTSASKDRGFAIDFDTQTLPKFVLWKNAAATSDGYVTGLEPATNFPNPRGFEESQGRVVLLKPESGVSFGLKLRPLVDARQVATVSAEIDKLSQGVSPQVHRHPKAGWSM